ncbi:hypothetical protein QZN01_20865 [Burkholderia cenocepacia]|uniref:hypothetical protein n=1 Tax=Burkholderia cenocepacia TaxID=95486 RepID=UPI002650D459|nr:hypothetical protein [Burkholderia cenocepacia]MDN7825107.1 hypothetical protein [Burkholderia cenocepacia]
MKRLVDADGRPLGDPSIFERNSLVAMETLNRLAVKMLTDDMKRREEIDRYFAIQELRRSCGVESPPLKIRIGMEKLRDGTGQP